MQTSMRMRSVVVLTVLSLGSIVAAQQVNVSITNLAPANGTFLTPVWVGFHDGTFDLYDRGAAASIPVERLAEDGDTGALRTAFSASAGGLAQETIAGPGGPLAPGDTASIVLDLNGPAGAGRYFSYMSMVIPSNDAFIANGNPLAHPIIDDNGVFQGADFIVLGNQVLDAGTEVNDEVPANTAFFGQSSGNTGVTQNGVVELHTGFLPVSSGGILADSRFAAGDFLAPGYQIARISVTQVPEPATITTLFLGCMMLCVARRRQCMRI
jgi:hypothetical protein